MSLLPKTAADWTRSLAFPLFGICVVVLFASTMASFGGDKVWKYSGGSIGGVLLPILGCALGLTCLFGKGLDKTFRKIALIIAGLSVLLGPLLMPALS